MTFLYQKHFLIGDSTDSKTNACIAARYHIIWKTLPLQPEGFSVYDNIGDFIIQRLRTGLTI